MVPGWVAVADYTVLPSFSNDSAFRAAPSPQAGKRLAAKRYATSVDLNADFQRATGGKAQQSAGGSDAQGVARHRA